MRKRCRAAHLKFTFQCFQNSTRVATLTLAAAVAKMVTFSEQRGWVQPTVVEYNTSFPP